MRDMFLKSLPLEDENGVTRRYDYYIVVDETGGPWGWESYGIRIGEQGGVTAEVRGITCSAQRIGELCRLVMEGGVTPITLTDIVSDWL